MSPTAERVEAGRSPPIAPLDERPATVRPPSESEAPPDDVLDADGLDIDALLPATFESGSARIAMGLDLADLLRAAEERIEARIEPSRPLDAQEEGARVPVPEDVLALLGEPLEGDDEESATGANLGSFPGGTHDGIQATPHGIEEDLEQPLPRASDVPRPTTLGGPSLTSAGRVDSAPPQAEPARASASTRPGDSDGAPQRVETSSPRTSERSLRFPTSDVPPDRTPLSLERVPLSLDRGPMLERTPLSLERTPISIDRGPTMERAPLSLERTPASIDRGPTMDRGPASFDRDAAMDRGPAVERWSPAMERAAPMDHGAQMDRGMPMDHGAPMDRGDGRQVGSDRDRSAMRTMEMRAIERPASMEAAQRPAQRTPVVEVIDGPRSRAVSTEAVPAVLGPGDAARALGRAIAARVSGALLVTSDDEQRRILLHDGDVITAGSSVPVESLVAFLSARGDLDRDLVPRMASKLPAFGRHAGAALVAHGHLGQDDLWPVLRAHAEWIIGRTLLIESGTCELEVDPPARFRAEPSVFGGSAGAEVFVDAVQRVIAPETALSRLGGYGARLAQGVRSALLGECALDPAEEDAVRAAPGRTVHELAGDGPTDRWSMLYALWCLDVLELLPAIAQQQRREEPRVDPLDEEALRQRVRARLALVEEGDYFALLGVPRAATSYEIRRAYLDLRRTLEPTRVLTAGTADLADDLRLVLEVIEEAYEILRDAHRRDRYRRAIEAGPPR